MSNPSLPPLPEPVWPLQTLDEVVQSAAGLLDASRVWLALADRRGNVVPHLAFAAGTGALTPLDPHTTPDLVTQVIRQLTGKNSPVKPVYIGDVHAEQQLALLAGNERHALRSLAGMALAIDGRAIGALIVGWAQPGAGVEARRREMTFTVAQLLTVIRIATSAERTAAQVHEFDALLRASQALTGSLESTEVLRAVIQAIKQVIVCESALVYRYDDDARELRVIADLGEGTEQLEGAVISIDNRDARAAWAARHMRPFIGLVGPGDTIGAHTNVLIAGETMSLLCMPLMTKGRLRGVASLARPTAFSEREMSAMQRLSPIAAAALENVELYHREQAGRQQQEALFASASDGFALIDDSLRFVMVNVAFGRYVASGPEELHGRPCCEVINAARGALSPATCLLCQPEGHCLVREALDTQQARDHVECLFPPPSLPDAPHASVGPQPQGRTIDFSLTPVQRPEGQRGLLLVGRDVSAAREIERVRAEYIYMTSHELSQPLQNISYAVDLVNRAAGQRLNAEQHNLLNSALASTYGMKALVQDLALLSTRDAGQWTINPYPTDLGFEAGMAAEEMRLIAEEKGVTLLTQPPQRLPLALIDPVRARQVARNLILNAIKFTPLGGQVRVSVGADAERVLLRVEDTGMGIPQDALELIWNRYYRAPQPAGVERIAGQGLGLAIVRIIVDAHNGTRQVESVLGKGSVFTVGFPRADLTPRR
ncbi:MAG TPA: ATP-binding protein [Ktedonobacterales bacterium]